MDHTVLPANDTYQILHIRTQFLRCRPNFESEQTLLALYIAIVHDYFMYQFLTERCKCVANFGLCHKMSVVCLYVSNATVALPV